MHRANPPGVYPPKNSAYSALPLRHAVMETRFMPQKAPRHTAVPSASPIRRSSAPFPVKSIPSSETAAIPYEITLMAVRCFTFTLENAFLQISPLVICFCLLAVFFAHYNTFRKKAQKFRPNTMCVRTAISYCQFSYQFPA